MGCKLTAEEVAHIDRTIADLKDENARLRSCLSDDAENARTIMAENAKLREQIHWLKQGDILHVLTDQEYIDQCEREHLMQVSIDALDKDNAKLRELVADMWRFIGAACKKYPRLFDPATQGGQMVLPNAIDAFEQRMRELGVEP